MGKHARSEVRMNFLDHPSNYLKVWGRRAKLSGARNKGLWTTRGKFVRSVQLFILQLHATRSGIRVHPRHVPRARVPGPSLVSTARSRWFAVVGAIAGLAVVPLVGPHWLVPSASAMPSEYFPATGFTYWDSANHLDVRRPDPDFHYDRIDAHDVRSLHN